MIRFLMAVIVLGVTFSCTEKKHKVSEAKAEIQQYLRSLGHGNYLFGQIGTWVHKNNPDMEHPGNWLYKVYHHTGKWPAYGCITYDFVNNPYTDEAYNAGIKKMWDQGMIPGIYSWWANPSNPDGEPSSPCEVHKIFEEGENPVKTNFYTQLDRMAANIQQLSDWGIPVIYTPFVELNHQKKWFGTDGKENALNLHRLVHEYFSRKKDWKTSSGDTTPEARASSKPITRAMSMWTS
ncbi:MAG: hypothetical protein HC819_13305 [Cyclobacteriaceae bacterium]|nr:hypothetical protein [Cyclobacteriaceae bacterium]